MKKTIIAEIGSVHDGSFGNACKLIELAAEVGADAVKFQTHLADAESTVNAPSPSYFSEEDRLSYFRRTSFTLPQWHKLANCARLNNLQFISSPFSLEAVDLLEEVNMSIYKIPSGEVTNIPLLEKISRLNKPVLLSTGMSSISEIENAVEAVRSKADLVIMQCTSLYPCPEERVGLNVIQDFGAYFPDFRVGFSDHTTGIAAGCAAAALGAVVIEKHLTFSRQMYGSDAKNSLEPQEFKSYTSCIKSIWNILAHPIDKNDLSSVYVMKEIFQKSIVYKRDLPANHTISLDDLAYKKPGTGICASQYSKILGYTLCRSVQQDQMVGIGDFK